MYNYANNLDMKINKIFLFTVKASNATIASEASKTAVLDINKMDIDSVPGFGPDEDFGGIITDMPFDLSEENYLDSFVDLSNFLLPVRIYLLLVT